MGKLNFKKSIEKLIELRSVTLQYVADETDITLPTLLHIMNGTLEPSKGEIKGIATALDTDLESFLVLSVDRDSVAEDRKEIYDLLWKDIEKLVISFLK